MLKFVWIIIYIFLIFSITFIYKSFYPSNKELHRKFIHIGIGPIIPIAQYLEINQKSAFFTTGIISLLILFNYRYKLFPAIEDIERKSYGTLFYCLSLFVLIFLYWNKDPTSLVIGFLIMTFGDGFAGLIGKNFKSKNWIFFKQTKSLLGTITMFITSLAVLVSVGYFGGYSFNVYFISLALLATILEQFSFLGIDNFIVPITSAICFHLLIVGE